MSKSLCYSCVHNCTNRKNGVSANYSGIWCNAEYGRVINKNKKAVNSIKNEKDI